RGLLWYVPHPGSIIYTFDPAAGRSKPVLELPYPALDLCPSDEGLWVMAGGGKLGRRLVLWSLGDAREVRQFNCPDGAAAGVAVDGHQIWLPHRYNRKLFCLDTRDGKTRWMIRTEKETYSPASWDGNLWLIEIDPGPLGHWSGVEQAKCSFVRYDTAREIVVDRLPIPFLPGCMAFDGEQFWYSELGKNGFRSIQRKSLRRA
ncbi:MAG: hypothetical protein GTO40_22585, partial [Deltaproteobacteria bacterium]|nr:hypothetical protein [Deltaproteobacteria bacterium]